MNYGDPQLRSILAGEYVLGTMPPRTRVRFERLMRYDSGLVRLVGDWAERLQPIDATAPSIEPGPHVWAAVAARTKPIVTPRAAGRISFWRGLALASSAVAVALLILVTTMMPRAPQSQIVAVLADKDGQPGWIVSNDKRHDAVEIEAVRSQPIDAQHAFELWVIADSKPIPLGVIDAAADHRVSVPQASLPKNGTLFAVSLEPPGGSPTGQPTGPVLYQGKILNSL